MEMKVPSAVLEDPGGPSTPLDLSHGTVVAGKFIPVGFIETLPETCPTSGLVSAAEVATSAKGGLLLHGSQFRPS